MVMKELITNQTEIKVYSFYQPFPESTEVDLFLFDDHVLHFNHIFDKVCLHESTALLKRPDRGGTIFEMMKNNKHVFLFDRVWYQVSYKADHHNFCFEPCNTHNFMARYSCTLFNPVFAEKQTLQSLLQAMIFGEKLADRLMGERYQELCLKMTRLSLDVKEQKEAFQKIEDEWNSIKKQIVEERLDCYRHVKRCKAEHHRVKCLYCDETFSRKNGMKRHMKKKHLEQNGETFTCNLHMYY